MNKIQHRDICLKLESRFDSNSINATVFKFGTGELTCNDDGSWRFKGDADKSALELLEFLSSHSMTRINDLQQTIVDQHETIEKLEKRELEAENILNRLIEDEGCYCSDFGNLLEPEDQDSKIVADAIRFMNNHVQKFKELNND